MDFKKYFPSQYKPNKNQEYILEELNKAWNLGKKYIIINAPTGSGKSIISKTIAQSAPDISATYRDFVDSGAIYDIEEDDVPEYQPKRRSSAREEKDSYDVDFIDL